MFPAIPNEKKELFKILKRKGITAVSRNYLQVLFDTNEYLTSDNAKFGEVDLKIRKLGDKIPSLQNDHSREKEFFILTKDLLWLVHMKKSYQANNQLCAQLCDSKWWTEFLVTVPTEIRPEVERERVEWELHGKYAAFSTPDLVRVYEIVLPIYTNWINWANKELNTKRNELSADEIDQYQKYLDEISECINKEKISIRLSFIARFKAGVQKQDLRFDDLVMNTLHKLRTLNVVKRPDSHNKLVERCTVSPKEVASIQQIIHKDGNESEKSNFEDLLFNKKENKGEVTRLSLRQNTNNYVYRIPKKFGKYIPKEITLYSRLPKWLQKLLKGRKIRDEFFQNNRCQYLLSIKKTWSDMPINMSDILSREQFTPAWKQINHILHQIDMEEKRRMTSVKSLSKFLHRYTLSMLGEYQNTLISLAKKSVAKQMTLLTNFISARETAPSEHPLLDEEKIYLKKLLDTFDNNYHEWMKDETLQYKQLMQRGKSLLSNGKVKVIPTNVFRNASNVLLSLQKNVLIPSEEKATLKMARENLPTDTATFTPDQNEYVTQKVAASVSLPKLFRDELSIQVYTLPPKNLITHIKIVKQLYLFMQEIQADESNKFINSAEYKNIIYQYTYNLICSIYNSPSKDNFTKMKAEITLILDCLDEILVGNNFFKTSVIAQLRNAQNQVENYEWNFFRENFIKPYGDALKKLDKSISSMTMIGDNSQSIPAVNKSATSTTGAQPLFKRK